MRIIRGVLGVVVILLGLLWIGQGLGFIPGSMMSGQSIYALLGLLCVLVGVWLVSALVRPSTAGSRRG